MLEPRVKRGHKVTKETKVLAENRVLMELMGRTELMELMELTVTPDKMVLLVNKDLRDL